MLQAVITEVYCNRLIKVIPLTPPTPPPLHVRMRTMQPPALPNLGEGGAVRRREGSPRRLQLRPARAARACERRRGAWGRGGLRGPLLRRPGPQAPLRRIIVNLCSLVAIRAVLLPLIAIRESWPIFVHRSRFAWSFCP
jgi:hypothetical protein